MTAQEELLSGLEMLSQLTAPFLLGGVSPAEQGMFSTDDPESFFRMPERKPARE